MSVFHHRAELISLTEQDATYRYFPDTAMHPACEGVFRVSIPTWDIELVNPADAEARVRVTTDDQCVSRLVYKLRKHFQASGEILRQISWIA